MLAVQQYASYTNHELTARSRKNIAVEGKTDIFHLCDRLHPSFLQLLTLIATVDR